MICGMLPTLYKAGIYTFGMEFGAEEDQQRLDSLITARQYDEQTARDLMMNYHSGWAIKEYTNVYKAAWTLNHSLPANARKFRILNISYKYNFAGVGRGERTSTKTEEIFYKGNTEFFRAALIKREILDKHEKLLVICGWTHAFTKYNAPYYDYHQEHFYSLDTNCLGNILHRIAPDKVFTIMLHMPFESLTNGYTLMLPPAEGNIDRVMGRFADKRVGFDLGGTPFGKLYDTSRYELRHPNFTMADMADGYIYQRPFNEYEDCTFDSLFITDKTWPRVLKNFSDQDLEKIPASKDDYIAQIKQYIISFKWRYRNLVMN